MTAQLWPQSLLPWTVARPAARLVLPAPGPGLRYQERIARLQAPRWYSHAERGLAKQRRLAARLVQARVRARHLSRRARG